MRYVLWLEWEGFYVNPAIPDPVVVIRDKRVIDANRPARLRGVSPGMDVPQSRNLVREAKYIDWKEEDHTENQRQWLDVCTNFTGVIEPVDQHIAVLDLSAHPNQIDIAERIVQSLVRETGLTLRHGAGPSPWIAQLAAKRPLASIAAANPATFLAPLSVKDLAPIPLAHRERLEFLGYSTIGQVARIPLSTLRSQFGEEALLIRQAACGGLVQPVHPLYPLGSVRECFLFESPVEDWETIRAAAADLAKRVGARLENRQGSTLLLELEDESGKVRGARRRFTKQIHHHASAMVAIRTLLDSLITTSEEKVEPISAIRATLTELESLRVGQHRLIDSGARPQTDNAMLYVQRTFGEDAVRLAGKIEAPRRSQVLKEWRDATGWH